MIPVKTFKRVWNWITGILVVICVLLAFALTGIRLIGINPYIVISGSMEPTYPTGCVIYVKPVEASEVKAGDPITFTLNAEGTIGTHRVVEVDEENKCFYTKGDNNEDADGKPVPFANLLGTPVYHIPKLGYFADFISHPPGMYVAIAVGCFLFLMLFVPDLLAPSAEEEEKKKKANKDQEELKKQQEQIEKELQELKSAVEEKTEEPAPADETPVEE